MSIREGEEIAPATLRKYRTFTKQLSFFAESRGYVMLDRITSGDVDRFYSIITACDRLGEISWQSGNRTGAWSGEDRRLSRAGRIRT